MLNLRSKPSTSPREPTGHFKNFILRIPMKPSATFASMKSKPLSTNTSYVPMLSNTVSSPRRSSTLSPIGTVWMSRMKEDPVGLPPWEKIRLFKHVNNTCHANIVLVNKFYIWESTHDPVCRIMDQREIALLIWVPLPGFFSSLCLTASTPGTLWMDLNPNISKINIHGMLSLRNMHRQAHNILIH